jgi:phosphoenolpyruvate carboxykinase (ATP)
MKPQGRATPESVAFPNPVTAPNITYNPSFEELRAASVAMETTTEFDSPSYVSEFRSRSSDRTKNATDDEFTAADYEVVKTARAHVVDEANELFCIDRKVGRHPETAVVCRLYIPKKYGRIGLAWAKLLEPATDVDEPDFVTVQLPDHDETAIRILPDEGFTAVLGSDYTGEAKKSFLRLFMLRAKQRGGLGLHAGSKRVRIAQGDAADGEVTEDDLTDVGQLFLGLSGTGKSTLTGHGLWLDGPEEAEMLQDDVCALLPDGTVTGSEGAGLYIKTIGLTEDQQPELYRAATDESAVLENVDVADDGTVDFDSDHWTGNGRAIVQRDSMDSSAADIDLEEVDQLFFITRNPLVPPMAKLSIEQAAAAFMLGESIETSAGDPTRAGESIRVVGTNPFIVGSEGEEGNRFRDLIADLDVDCYVLNTGAVGTGNPIDVGVTETITLLREVARDRIEWEEDETTGLLVPSYVPGMDANEFRVGDRTDNADDALAALRTERRVYLQQFEDLDAAIVDAVY